MNPKRARALADKTNRLLQQTFEKQSELKQCQLNQTEARLIKDGINTIEYRIEGAAAMGNYFIYLDTSCESVANKIARHFNNLGFKTSVSHNCSFTGVDEWEDSYSVRVAWYD